MCMKYWYGTRDDKNGVHIQELPVVICPKLLDAISSKNFTFRSFLNVFNPFKLYVTLKRHISFTDIIWYITERKHIMNTFYVNVRLRIMSIVQVVS